MSITKYGEDIIVIGKLTEKKDDRVYPVQILVMEGAIWRSTLALHQPQNRTFCLMKQYTMLSRPRSSPSEVRRASPNYRRVNTPQLPSPSSSSSSSVSKPSSFSFICPTELQLNKLVIGSIAGSLSNLLIAAFEIFSSSNQVAKAWSKSLVNSSDDA